MEPFQIKADSSDFTTGAVLSQQSAMDRKWRPVAFYSKFLSPVEQNYEIHDKEMLAIIHALEEWRHFLEGTAHPVQIWIDHKNLEYFMTTRKLNCRQAWWSLYLACFNFTLCYCPGQSMDKLDTLSQRPDHGDRSLDNKDIVLLCPKVLAVWALKRVELVGAKHSILAKVWKGNHTRDLEEPVAKAAIKLQCSASKTVHSLEWLNINGLLCFRGKIYIP